MKSSLSFRKQALLRTHKINHFKTGKHQNSFLFQNDLKILLSLHVKQLTPHFPKLLGNAIENQILCWLHRADVLFGYLVLYIGQPLNLRALIPTPVIYVDTGVKNTYAQIGMKENLLFIQ